MKEQDLGVKWFNTVFYPENKTARAERYEDGVLPRLRQQVITLFTPWGPRYSWESRGTKIGDVDKEIVVLNFLASLFTQICQNMPGKEFRWLFLGADSYGTRINGLPERAVADYFSDLAQRLRQILPFAEFKLWSELSKSAEKYRQEFSKNFERRFYGSSVLIRANTTAQLMGRGGNPKEYIIERLAEASLFEEMLCPIKVSCVARYKDDTVDAKLPRLYFLPEHLHAPWL